MKLRKLWVVSSTRSVGMNLARRFNAGVQSLLFSSRSDD
jgi:hypothetical protein